MKGYVLFQNSKENFGNFNQYFFFLLPPSYVYYEIHEYDKIGIYLMMFTFEIIFFNQIRHNNNNVCYTLPWIHADSSNCTLYGKVVFSLVSKMTVIWLTSTGPSVNLTRSVPLNTCEHKVWKIRYNMYNCILQRK